MIGTFYLVFGIVNGVLGYLFSFFIRVELDSPVPFLFLLDYAQFYNAYATAHGVIMIFFFIMPFLIGGAGNAEIPKDANIKDFCLPRLNNASF
jgi:cytochrome c oxidase subunit 1